MLLLLMMMMMTCVCVRERERLWLETRSSGLEFYDNVVDDVCVRISNLDTAREIWEKLQEEFFGNERTKKM